jgi:sugar phosphate isomerase/epimerase
MHISAMLTSLPLDFAAAVAVAAEMGFTHVDVVALEQRPEADLHALADSGLLVSCAALGRGLPPGCSLDAPGLSERKQAVEIVKRHLSDAARLGATHAYVIPGLDDSSRGLARLADSCSVLADFADSRMMRLCIEHFPRKALPSVARTLAWLDENRLDNLQLLLDVGHCLISEEEPAQAAAAAGSRLGYVHFDDNDSVEDLHWPLLSGRLTRDMIDAVAAVLQLGRYDSGLALELNAKNADPIGDLRRGKAILEQAGKQRLE